MSDSYENLRSAWRDRSVEALKIARDIDTAPAFFKSSYLHQTLRQQYQRAEYWVAYWTAQMPVQEEPQIHNVLDTT